MWPFSRKRGEEQRSVTSIPGYWPDIGDSGSAVASVSRSLSLAPVFAAARLLADSIASLPPVLYSRDRNGIPRRQPTPPLFINPSIHGTLYDWLFRAVISMALQGDAIGLITNTDDHQYPTMIEWLNPEQVATFDGKLYGPGSYMNPMWWWWGRPIDPRQLVHIPWFTLPYRVRGVSPIGAYQLTTNIGIGAQEYSANWFGQGGVPPGTLRNTDRVIDPKDADILTARITSRLQSRKPLVLGRDWEYTPIAIKPHEAEFIQTVQMTATQIANIYGLPPEYIGGTTGHGLHYSSQEQDSIKFLSISLRPWLVRLEYALTRCFRPGQFVKFDVNEMLRVDAKTKADVDATSLGYQQTGWRTVDEIRATHDLPPMPKSEQRPPPPSRVEHHVTVADSKVKQDIKDNDEPPNQPASNVNHVLSENGDGKQPISGRQALIETLSLASRWGNHADSEQLSRSSVNGKDK